MRRDRPKRLPQLHLPFTPERLTALGERERSVIIFAVADLLLDLVTDRRNEKEGDDESR